MRGYLVAETAIPPRYQQGLLSMPSSISASRTKELPIQTDEVYLPIFSQRPYLIGIRSPSNSKESDRVDIGKGHHGPIWTCSFSPAAKIYATRRNHSVASLYILSEFDEWVPQDTSTEVQFAILLRDVV
jgi:hypothetical protein